MKKAVFLTGIICITLIYSCKKSAKPFNAVNAELKATFNYMPGTYWIYKDSISGRIDSFFVTAYYDNIGAGATVTVETILIPISEYNENAPSLDTEGWLLTYNLDEIELQYNTNKVLGGNISYNPLINYPFLDSLVSYVPGVSQDSAEVSVLNYYTVNGQNFSNVGAVNEHVNYQPFLTYGLYTTDDWFYICPQTGIIKMRLNHPQDSINRVWELQRWHIIKE